MTKQPNIPDLVDVTPAGLRNWAKQLRMALGVVANDIPTTDESAKDVAVTFRDLIDAGIVTEAPEGSKSKYVAGTNPGAGILVAPPAPTGFSVTRAPYKMYLTWDVPEYGYHKETEIWRSPTNNLSAATKVAAWPVHIYEDAYQDGQAWFYWIRHVSLAGIPGGFNSISGTGADSQPGDVSNLTYEFEGFGVRLRWNPVLDADLSVYEVRVGATWDSAVRVEETKGISYLWKVQLAGSYRIWVRAKDVSGYYSGSATSVDINILAPAQTSLTAAIIGDSFNLSWNPIVGTFAIDYYELRLGTTWAGGTTIDRAFTTAFFKTVNWSGTQRYWVAAVDVAGNVATPISVDVVITPPGAVSTLRAEVVDNNVLLYWTDPAVGTLPITTYEIWRGATFGTSIKVGEKSGLFTSLFEQISGTYTYWLRAKDTAGNVGTETPITTKVNQPPDYILYSDLNVDLSTATLVNATYDGSGISLPFNTSETWDAHYTSRSWTNDDNAIAAGFPVYAQPTPSTGSMELNVDYGATIPATGIIVNPTITVIAGTPTYSVQIQYKLGIGDSWTDLSPGVSGFIAASFRYVRVILTATNGGDQKGLYRVTNFNVKLNVKQKTLGRFGSCAAGDAGGTEFLLTTDNTQVVTTGNNTSGQNTITSLGTLAGITVGMTVEGTGIVAGTTVTAVNTPSGGVTLSQVTSSGTSGGTYKFGEAFFVDLLGPPIAQPKGTTPIIAVVDFVDAANPLRFKVLLFNDMTGTRVSGDISWMARGV
jgi:hypothetical protein